jgi:hypothetical protein
MATVSILVFGILMCALGGMGIFVLYLVDRWRKGYVLIVKKDFRNPERKIPALFLLPKKAEKVMNIYKHVWSFKPEKVIPFFDVNAYKDKKIIKGFIGVSGKPEDDNIVPYGEPIMSGVAAGFVASKISDGIKNALKDITVPLNDDKIREIFTDQWVMKLIGVREVQDANIVLLSQKAQVSSLHSLTNEFRKNYLSTWAKYQLPIMFGIVVFILFIAAIPIISATLQYQQGLAATTQAFIQNVRGTAPATAPLPNPAPSSPITITNTLKQASGGII